MDSLGKAPEPSAQSLYFPFDPEQNRFRASFYEEGMTNGHVNKKEVQSFIGGINNFSSTFAEFQKSPKFVTYMMISGLLSIIAGCIIVFYGRYYASSQVLSIIGFIGIVGGLYLGFKAVTMFLDNAEEMTQQVRGQLSEYIDKNSQGFKNKQLAWKVPEDHFDWIELTVVNSGLANAKNKSMFSEKDTRVTLGDSISRRDDSTFMDVKNQSMMSKPLLSQI